MTIWALMRAVNIRFLGPLQLLVDGAHVPVERARTRALLALMATRPGTHVTRDSLIGSIWQAQSTPRAPADALRTIVARARRALHDEDRTILRSDGVGYVLELDPLQIDLHRFERAATTRTNLDAIAEALQLWRGRPFDDCGVVDDLYWEAMRLDQLRWDLAERHVELLVRSSRYEQAIALGRPMIAERPAELRLAATVIAALGCAGRRGEAELLLAQTRRRALDDDPDADLAALDVVADRLMTHVAPVVDRLDLATVVPHVITPSRLAPHVTELHGRSNELAMLEQAAESAVEHGRLAIVIGEPGVGKTSLAASFGAALGWQERSVRLGLGADENLLSLVGLDPQSASTAAERAALASRSLPRRARPARSRRSPAVGDRRPAVDRRGRPEHLALAAARRIARADADGRHRPPDRWTAVRRRRADRRRPCASRRRPRSSSERSPARRPANSSVGSAPTSRAARPP